MPSDFAYTEPSIAHLLTLFTYLWLLNLARWVVQYLVGAGLLGEIAIGIIYGSPLAGWLDVGWQETMVVLGYLGLLLIVLEGGITTSLPILIPLLPLSLAIALTGLLAPIALSFILSPAFSYPHLHSFASGSAMSSTSLGTTLAVLASTRIPGFDLRQAKLGVVLVGAAVIHDVVAFVLAEIMEILGESGGGGSSLGGHIGRAVGVTIGLGVVAIPLTIWVVRPLLHARRVVDWLQRAGSLGSLFIVLLVSVGSVAASGYAGTSPLYGIYLGGLVLSYSSTTNPSPAAGEPPVLPAQASIDSSSLERAYTQDPASTAYHFASLPPITPPPHPLDFEHTYNTHLGQIVEYLLLPIFFGSIGYAIPFLRLWRGRIVWKGVCYSLLMFLGKAITGMWMFWPWAGRGQAEEKGAVKAEGGGVEGAGAVRWGWKDRVPAAMFLGCAMVARGEIGLLIAQIGRHTSTPLLTDDEFLIAIWAIVLNTIVGPVGVGMVLKRFGSRVVRGGWE
ncbi:hypothetical protein IAT38_001873 [Cryptococcus sp. DSM 104549]